MVLLWLLACAPGVYRMPGPLGALGSEPAPEWQPPIGGDAPAAAPRGEAIAAASLFAQAREARVLHRKRIPSPGDIAFFDDTWDANGNGRVDDPLSHVAVVEEVDAAGTITLVHTGSKGVSRLLMNLRHPEDAKDEQGRLINSILRVRRSGDSPRTRYLTGELWVGFASFWRAAPSDQLASAERSTR